MEGATWIYVVLCRHCRIFSTSFPSRKACVKTSYPTLHLNYQDFCWLLLSVTVWRTFLMLSFQAAEKAKQTTTSKTLTENKIASSSSNGCEKVNGVHHNGTSDVLRNRQLSEERRKHEIPNTNNVKERIDGKSGQRRKAEEQKHKQAEVPDEVCKSRKKQNHAHEDVMVSRQVSKVECNGKENNFSSRRKTEEKSEKKRQESVSPDPPAPVCNHKEEGQDKSDNSCRLPQKKQGKKKKKVSLGEKQQVKTVNMEN